MYPHVRTSDRPATNLIARCLASSVLSHARCVPRPVYSLPWSRDTTRGPERAHKAPLVGDKASGNDIWRHLVGGSTAGLRLAQPVRRKSQ